VVTRAAADVLADLAALAARQAALAARQAELTAELASALRSAPAPAPTPAPEGAPEYLTTAETARLLGVSTRTLEALRAEGQGPAFVRVGRAIRYPASAVRAPSSASASAPSVFAADK
jgi:excisionase family DNA binding protein